MVPGLTGTAVNVGLVPAQIVLPGLAEIVTLTAIFGLTVIVMRLLVAGLPVAQGRLEVSSHQICSFV